MSNPPMQLPKQPSSNTLDPRHLHRPNILVSPQPTLPRDHSSQQYHGNYSNFSPYCHSSDQHVHENAMYPRDCHHDHINMSPSGAFNNCWAAPHSCHHSPHPEMGYNFCMPPPYPHYPYGCCVPKMNDKIPCNKMSSYQPAYQKKPYSPGFAPYRPRRKKQVNFQNVGESSSQQQQTTPFRGTNEQVSNGMGSSFASPSAHATSAAESVNVLPPGYKVFNISVEATPSGYQMSAPDGLTLSEEHIENIIKVVSTGKAVYTPPGSDGTTEVIAPESDNAVDNERYIPAVSTSKTDMNLMAGDAGMVCYEGGSGEAVQQCIGIVPQETGIHYTGPTEATLSDNSQPDTIVIQKSVYCHSNGTIEKLPQEYIQLSSSNLTLYGQNDMIMPSGVAEDSNSILQVNLQQREQGFQVVENENGETESGTSSEVNLAQQNNKDGARNEVDPESLQVEYGVHLEQQGGSGAEGGNHLHGVGEPDEENRRQESPDTQNDVSTAGSEEDIFVSVTD